MDTDKGHSFEVVKKLLRDHIGKGHILFLDNFYNSVELAEYLMNNKTNMSGTLRSTRAGNPEKVSAMVRQNFFHLLDVSLWNGVYIFSRLATKTTYLKFRDIVIKNYIQIEPIPRNPRSSHSSQSAHTPVKLEKRLRCHVCRDHVTLKPTVTEQINSGSCMGSYDNRFSFTAYRN
ncbi:hypothetical protein J6590_034511 [Homalodisca vitripennis]|nr:hypothetical protein J6590_034511 [Homalodisca vitripennis]